MGQWAIFGIISIFALPGLIMGIALCCGKGAGMIAGYSTASPEEKATWNQSALCRGVGILLLAMIACIELTLAGVVLGNKPMIWGFVALLAVITGGGLLYINKSPRFRK